MEVKGGGDVVGEGLGGPLSGGSGVVGITERAVTEGIPSCGCSREKATGSVIVGELVCLLTSGVGEAGPVGTLGKGNVGEDGFGAVKEVVGEISELTKLVDGEGEDACSGSGEVRYKFGRRDGLSTGAIKLPFCRSVVCFGGEIAVWMGKQTRWGQWWGAGDGNVSGDV